MKNYCLDCGVKIPKGRLRCLNCSLKDYKTMIPTAIFEEEENVETPEVEETPEETPETEEEEEVEE